MLDDFTLGIMEGRLLPPVNGNLQAFPGKEWEKEFSIASECGLDAIEMIYDVEGIEYNPLNSDSGMEHLQKICNKNNIKILSVCADYFMHKGFIRVHEEEREKSVKTLKELTCRCNNIGIKNIVIPFVDESEIKTSDELDQAGKALVTALENTDRCNVNYALEMSLPGEKIAEFIKHIGHPRLKVNYDTGNSAALGYDLASEINLLGDLIVDIHIKDRIYNGESCILGTGNTNFDDAFEAFSNIGFKGLFILQAQRIEDEINTIKQYLRFVKDKINKYY